MHSLLPWSSDRDWIPIITLLLPAFVFGVWLKQTRGMLNGMLATGGMCAAIIGLFAFLRDGMTLAGLVLAVFCFALGTWGLAKNRRANKELKRARLKFAAKHATDFTSAGATSCKPHSYKTWPHAIRRRPGSLARAR
jgi:hypothetical protein